MEEFKVIKFNKDLDLNTHDSNTMIMNRRRVSLRHKQLRRIQRNARALLLTALIVLFLVFSFNALNASATTTEEAANHKFKYYKSIQVEAGDSLWSIASKYTDGTVSEIKKCVNEIKNINNLDKQGTIQTGYYIIIPYYSTEHM